MGQTFEMAHVSGWITTECVLVGEIAVHKEKAREWRLSHAATGMSIPYAYFTTRSAAVASAERLHVAVDFSRVRRASKTASPGFVRGWSKSLQAILVAELRRHGLAPAEEA